jgi:hypothetical protein
MGATMGLSKQMQQQNLLQLLQALSSPLGQSLMGQINAVNFFRGIFRVFEVPSINDIFTMNPQLAAMLQNPALAQMTQGGTNVGGVPTSAAITNGGPSVIPGMPGQNAAGAGSPATLLAPPNIGAAATTMPPMAAA